MFLKKPTVPPKPEHRRRDVLIAADARRVEYGGRYEWVILGGHDQGGNRDIVHDVTGPRTIIVIGGIPITSIASRVYLIELRDGLDLPQRGDVLSSRKQRCLTTQACFQACKKVRMIKPVPR